MSKASQERKNADRLEEDRDEDRLEVGVREFRDRLSRWLSLVQSGQEFVITDRGRPIARLSPVEASPKLDALIAAGLARLPQRPARRSEAYPKVTPKQSVVDLFLEEKRRD